jgi:hypothetical protein
LSNQRISKQAIAKRINSKCVEFMRSVVFASAAHASKFKNLLQYDVFEPFRRVLIQDSTVVSLPDKLASHFPGPVNQSRKKGAALKIQAVYDLLGQNFPYFSLSGFTKTDQAASGDILTIAKPGDLVLRDLGYFSIGIFKSMIDLGVYFLSRLRYGIVIKDPTTLKTIDILAELKRHGRFDQWVRIGAKGSITVRLVALPVPGQVANERRRKAKNNRDKRCKLKKAHLELMGWSVFVTTVPESIWTSDIVEKVYRVRWRIEIIFKAWKSHFHLSETPAGSVYELETLVWAKLLKICIFQNLFGKLDLYYSTCLDARASLLKVAQFFNCLLTSLLRCLCDAPIPMEAIEPHLRLEKRKEHQRLATILLLS